MTRRVRLGMLTPSSNTVLEPVTMAMLAGLPDVSAHFSRFKVTEIALSEQALGQFDDSEILRAAELLAHSPHPSDAEIKEALDPLICRCGTHNAAFKAVKRASGQA